MKKYWKKIKRYWTYVHDENVYLGWVIDLILAILLIQLVIFPLLSFGLGTDLPVVAVVSTSMEHNINVNERGQYFMCGKTFASRESVDFDFWWNNCGSWYENNADIGKEDFQEFTFSNGFNEGDVMIVKGTRIEDVEVGQVLVFEASRRSIPIIHRVVSVRDDDQIILQAKGDNNGDVFSALGEDRITADEIKGVAIGRIPYVGLLKIYTSRLFGGIL